jgi:glycosyltransferase involved in cell wall biosynthesis
VKTILSVLNQSYSNWEMVIVCRDREILTKFGIVTNPRIRIIPEIESGIYQNFNLGIQNAQGEFIGILNDDDWYEPNFIELAVSTLNHSDWDGVYGDCILHSDSSTYSRVSAKKDLKQRLLSDFLGAYHTTFILRTKSFEEYGLFKLNLGKDKKISYANDYEWFVSSLLSGLRLIKNDQIIGNFAIGGASTNHRKSLISEGKMIASLHSRSLVEKIWVEIVWRLRSVYNAISFRE